MAFQNGHISPSCGEWTDFKVVALLITERLNMRPLMQVQDVYKLLYQGIMGSEHILGTQKTEQAIVQFEQRLRSEYEKIAPNESEPLLESIHPKGSLYRLNLGPYKARNGEITLLTTVCLDTTRQTMGTLFELKSAWKSFEKASELGKWPNWPKPSILTFTDWLDEAGFPPVHHSNIYRDAYQPAYRLIGEPGKLLIEGALR